MNGWFGLTRADSSPFKQRQHEDECGTKLSNWRTHWVLPFLLSTDWVWVQHREYIQVQSTTLLPLLRESRAKKHKRQWRKVRLKDGVTSRVRIEFGGMRCCCAGYCIRHASPLLIRCTWCTRSVRNHFGDDLKFHHPICEAIFVSRHWNWKNEIAIQAPRKDFDPRFKFSSSKSFRTPLLDEKFESIASLVRSVHRGKDAMMMIWAFPAKNLQRADLRNRFASTRHRSGFPHFWHALSLSNMLSDLEQSLNLSGC